MATKSEKPQGDNHVSRGNFSDFVGWVKAYKELVLGVAAIIGSVLLVKDYFATKADVAIIKCQLHAQIELTDSAVRRSESTSKLVSLKQDLAKLARHRPGLSETEAKLGMEIDKQTATLNAQTIRETQADARLRSGACQDEGSRASRSVV